MNTTDVPPPAGTFGGHVLPRDGTGGGGPAHDTPADGTPADGTPASATTPGSRAVDRAGLARMGLHLLLAALPLLAISAHVFGLARMNAVAALLVIPLAATIVGLAIFDPHPEDRVVVRGFLWGMVACVLYDVFRLDTVYMLGWWSDFIPTMGTWIVGNDDLVAGAVVGYLWRYVGDGGGIGVTFFVVAAFLGLHHRSARQVVGAAVLFAVFPVWTGLIGTVALAPDGQTMMFPLTPVTITLSLVGHLIFGLVLGLGFVKSRPALRHWPWTPLGGRARPGHAVAAVPAPVVPAPAVPAPAVPAPIGPTNGPGAAYPTSGEQPSVVSAPPRGAMPGPPAMPAGHPSAPFPRPQGTAGHPSGPLPRQDGPAATSVGLSFGDGAVPRSRGPAGLGTGATPVSASDTGPHGGAGTGSLRPSGRTRARDTPPGGATSAGGAHAAPSGETGSHTLDPETWALWQRQLATTVKGRHTHRWR